MALHSLREKIGKYLYLEKYKKLSKFNNIQTSKKI